MILKIKNIEINKNGEKQSFKLKIWDTVGQERFKSQCLIPLKNSLGLMLVYDFTFCEWNLLLIWLIKSTSIYENYFLSQFEWVLLC